MLAFDFINRFTHTFLKRTCFILICTALLSLALFPTRTAYAGSKSLSGILPGWTAISHLIISPDSQWVIYVADVDVNDRNELYSVPILGGIPKKLNPPLVNGGDVTSYLKITADSSAVVYLADQEVDERRELYRVSIDGGPVTKLNGSLATGGNIISYELDVDTGMVVYIADQDTNDVFELYSVPFAGGTVTKLNPPLTGGGDMFHFRVDPVGDRVVYSADQEVNDLYELFSVPIGGGAVLKLNQPVAASVTDFALAPGVAYVMYTAREAGTGYYQLFGNDTPGGVPRKRNYTLSPGETVTGFRISPTASQVVYTVWNGSSASLWRASPYAGSSQLLSEPAGTGTGVGFYAFDFAPNGERVVFRFQTNAGEPQKLQSVHVTGGPLNRVDLYVPAPGYYLNISRISADSQWVVFEEIEDTSSDATIFALPTIGGGKIYHGRGSQPIITPDSTRIIYYRLGDYENLSNLMSTQIFGGDVRNLTKARVNSFAYNPVISPDNQWIVYIYQLNNGAAVELRVSDGLEAPDIFENFLPLINH